MTTSAPTVGWIGLGNIGLPMARRVLAAGLPLQVWARRRETAAPLVDAGASLAENPEALARACDVIATIVGGPDDVRDLHRRMAPRARPGTVFVDMTTASPGNARESGELAALAGAFAIDAPVTGGVAGAMQGALTSFVGGDADALARARPVLEAFCKRIVPCGPAGSGYRMKLVNQTIVAGALLGIAQGAALARASGFPPQTVKDALGTGSASGFLFDGYFVRMMESAGPVSFTLGLFRKDLTLAQAECAAHGLSTAFVDYAIAAVDRAAARHGEAAGVQVLADRDPG